jgi:nicotinamidase-related amidase
MLVKTNRLAGKIPTLHPQWSPLNFSEILSLPTAWLSVGQSNSILSSFGAQSAEGLWARAREPEGQLANTLKLAAECRDAGIKVIWFRYEIFRDSYPGTPMDQAQWSYWTAGKNWSAAERTRDADLIDEVKAVMRPEDHVLHYSTLGNVFIGTMLPNYLNMWGIRTVILSGYHLDWCIEQAARSARDLGYMPIVVGDACGCGRDEDDFPTLERLNTFFAPVLSTDAVTEHLRSAPAVVTTSCR